MIEMELPLGLNGKGVRRQKYEALFGPFRFLTPDLLSVLSMLYRKNMQTSAAVGGNSRWRSSRDYPRLADAWSDVKVWLIRRT